MRNRLVFPQPFRPSSPTFSPGATEQRDGFEQRRRAKSQGQPVGGDQSW